MVLEADIPHISQAFRSSHVLHSADMKRLENDFERQQLAIQTTIASIQNTITEMQRRIVELEKESKAIGLKADLAKALNTPVRKLPPEILSYIFNLAIGTNVVLGRRGSRQWVGVAAASEVCSYWRNVILETPSLWATLSLHLHHTCIADLEFQNAKRYLQTAISHARGVPLSVTIEFYWFLPESGPWGQQFLPLLKIMMSRPWRSATIRHLGFGDGFASIQNSGIFSHLQSVEALEIEEARSVGQQAVLEGHPLFYHSESDNYNFPNLRKLLLPPLNPSFSHIPIPLRHQIFHPRLTHLRICVGEEYSETLESLRFCTSLKSLSLHIFPVAHSRRPDDQPLTCFDSLRELVVEVTEGESSESESHPMTSINAILQSITCPQLRLLRFQCRPEYDGISHYRLGSAGTIELEHFREFIERSGLSLKLRSFGLCGFPLSEGVILEMIEALPAIRERDV